MFLRNNKFVSLLLLILFSNKKASSRIVLNSLFFEHRLKNQDSYQPFADIAYKISFLIQITHPYLDLYRAKKTFREFIIVFL
ncbi:hypothetical protein BsIDN1_12960 [Bacillus safensis]|uniref:Uncharacterized protein n=1 Tax=Bacillus safensis TaxID=561879 RepID=A0A5S9M4G9_BACIA|nr:hypothetical protein BsIDN1_12960 [Bacillus safensis]